MKKNSFFNFTILVVVFLVHHSSCRITRPIRTTKRPKPDPGDFDPSTIKFKLYEHQTYSLEKHLVGTVAGADPGNVLSRNANVAVVKVIAGVIPGLNEVAGAIADTLSELDRIKNAQETKKQEAKAIVDTILSYLAKKELIGFLHGFSSVMYGFRLWTNAERYAQADIKIKEIINALADPASGFRQFPALATKILLPLATYVESRMKEVCSGSEEGMQYICKNSEIPCALAKTIEIFYQPTLLERLNQIDVATDEAHIAEFGKSRAILGELKYSENISVLSDSDPSDDWIGTRHQGDKATYDSEVRRELPAIKSSTSTKPIYPNLFSETKYEAVHDTKNMFLLRDNLGEQNEFFKFRHGLFIGAYFGLVGNALKKEFSGAHHKVFGFCDKRKYFDEHKAGGRAIVALGEVRIKVSNDRCDGGRSDNEIFCDPYVELTAPGKKYTSDIIKNTPGWAGINDIVYFGKMNKNTKFQIKVFDQNDIFGSKRYFSHSESFWSRYLTQNKKQRDTSFITNSAGSGVSMIVLWQDDFVNKNLFNFVNDASLEN